MLRTTLLRHVFRSIIALFRLVFCDNQAFRFAQGVLCDTILGHSRETITSCHTPIFGAYDRDQYLFFPPCDELWSLTDPI